MAWGRAISSAFYLLRDVDLLTAMLAVAKTGAAYLPLDPGFPEARLAFMVEDSDAAAGDLQYRPAGVDGDAANRPAQ